MEVFLGFVIGIALGGAVAAAFGIGKNHIYKQRYIRAKEQQNIYKTILDSNKDISYYYVKEPEMRFVYLSPSLKKILGWTQAEVNEQIGSFMDSVHPEDQELLSMKNLGEIDFSKPIIMRFKNKQGQYIWTEDNAMPICKDNKLVAITGNLRDISLRKRLEELIEYNNNYDTLTGIYNRRYFEWELEELNSYKNSRAAIILCELKGMKSSNSKLGLQGGNELIKTIADFLKDYSSENTKLFRISGDEFAYLMTDIHEEEVVKIMREIERASKNLKCEEVIPETVEIIIGHSYTLSSLGRMNHTLEEATYRAYKKKIG